MTVYTPFSFGHSFSSTLELEQLLDQKGILKLTMSDDAGARFSVTFDGYIAYWKIDESRAFVILSELAESGSTTNTFYRAEKSDLLAWFEKQTSGAYSDSGAVHYTVAALDDIVEVLSPYPPEIIQLNE
jgi:hypothetical protein